LLERRAERHQRHPRRNFGTTAYDHAELRIAIHAHRGYRRQVWNARVFVVGAGEETLARLSIEQTGAVMRQAAIMRDHSAARYDIAARLGRAVCRDAVEVVLEPALDVGCLKSGAARTQQD